ncbi:right-handed parallel beta-helix repeat-containing protein [Limisphaera sp. 4302-co]|uniref:right-handed parallel beta-helix repeat-containing protein n=1 Tax=Limisphaera sp. 4302-co TaxID=3400417 RepID=UPI003C2195F8
MKTTPHPLLPRNLVALLPLLLGLTSLRAETPVGGIITNSTTWTFPDAPYIVTNDVTVAPGVTLTIEPGVEVRFNQGTRLTIQGRLWAEGTPDRRIRFTRNTAAGATGWSRLDFTASPFESRIVHADIEYATGSGNVRGNQTRLYLEDVIWTNTTVQLLDLTQCSLVLRHSWLPSIQNNELVHISGMPANGHIILQGNVFGTTTGYNDILDITGGNRPGPILQLLDNVFLGAVDDCFDLDGTDAHIEGNIFLHVHQDAARSSTANAISTGADGGNTSELMIVRNIFYDCDHAILLKDGGSAVIQNNTFVRIRTNAPAAAPAAVVNFYEPRPGVTPGAAALLEGNIIWDVTENRLFLNFTNAYTELLVRSNLLPTLDFPGGPGVGNTVADPRFVNLAGPLTWDNIRSNLALLPDSPARGAGPNGLDLGALVPPGATVSGEPPSTTTQTWAVLRVAGPGIVAYKWRLNDGPWSDVVPLTNSLRYGPTLFDDAVPIVLSNLPPGTYAVEVLGLNSAGVWQDEQAPTISRTWTVLPPAQEVGGTLAGSTTWSGTALVHVTNSVTVPAGVTLTVDPGTVVRIAAGAGIRAQPGGRILIRGTPEAPVRIERLSPDDWSDLSATGTNAELVVRHAVIQGGQTAVRNGAHGRFDFVTFQHFPGGSGNTPILLSERAASIHVHACRFTNYYETLFRYGVIVVEDSLFESIRGDGIDFDGAAPGSVVRRCTLRHGAASNVDGIDLGSDSAGVTVEDCWIHDFPFDKGVSIGEASTNIVVRNCVIYDVESGVAVKDSSVAVLVQNTVTRARHGFNLYEKVAGQGGGHAIAWNNLLWNNQEDVTLDALSTLTLHHSNTGGPAPWPGEGNINVDPRFRNPALNDFRPDPESPVNTAGTNGTPLGALAAVGSFLVDSDADGVPDPHEWLWGLDMHDPADGSSDADGDGLSARAEFLAGSDARDPRSRLELTILHDSQGPSLIVPAVADRLYTIETRPLATGTEPSSWAPYALFTATNTGPVRVPISTEPAPGRWFRLGVQPAW